MAKHQMARATYRTIVLLTVILSLVAGLNLWIRQNTKYPDTPTKKLSQSFKNIRFHKTTVIIFHKTGCSDCAKVQKTVVNKVADSKNINYIVLDTSQQQSRQYVKAYNVTEVPTFIRLSYGKIESSYSGTKIFEINKMFHNN